MLSTWLSKNTAKKDIQNECAGTSTGWSGTPLNSQINVTLQDDIINESIFVDDANATVTEFLSLPIMKSTLEARKKSLNEKRIMIEGVKDESIKNILLSMMSDMEQCVEESDKILKQHNLLVQRCNEESSIINTNHRTLNNLTKGIGKLTDDYDTIRDRVTSLEVKSNSNYDSQHLNVILVERSDADEVECGTIGPRQKFIKILSQIKIVPPSNIVDVRLLTVHKYVGGVKKPLKVLRIRFNDTTTAGKIFSQIVKHNKIKSESGNNSPIKFFAEIPASKNIWDLKKICFELKNEGVLLNVRCSDRGVIVTYKTADKQDGRKEVIRSSVVTSEKEIDDLRRQLNDPDAFISVKNKYNADFWNAKRPPVNVNAQKRNRECDENEFVNIPKRMSTSTPKQ